MATTDNMDHVPLVRTLRDCLLVSTFRIFVNRSVSMDRIKYVGFDMDHTLVGKELPVSGRGLFFIEFSGSGMSHGIV